MTTGIWPWAEANQGLGGWIGSILTVLSLFAAWGLARAEYQRDKKEEKERVRNVTKLYIEVVREFEIEVSLFFGHVVKNHGMGIAGFAGTVLNANGMAVARDLIHVPVLQWPSIAAYKYFRTYWFGTLDLLNRGSAQPAVSLPKQELSDRDSARKALLAALEVVAETGRRS